MQLTVNHINQHEVEIEVSATWENVQTDYTDLLKRYTKIPIKGFRQGNAPLSVIENMFKKEINTDLASLCSQRLCRKALAENKLQAGSPISITEWEILPKQKFIFKANFLKMPEFEMPDYAHLNMTWQNEDDKLTIISERLLELTPFDLHNDFVERELQFSDDEEFTDEAKTEAANRVKLLLILKKIAQAESIDIDQQDVDARIAAIAEENNITIKELKDYLMQTGGLSRLADFLLAEQVLAYILEINE